MILRPESPGTETVAEISIHENTVFISFVEHNDDFREIVKDHGFRWDWDEKAWKRKCNQFTGSAEDRAAEIGNLLLRAGFVVDIENEAVREKAVSGEFEPEILRWIAKRTTGKYNGWFAITWEYGNDRIYKAARAIGGSKWNRPAVVIPSQQFEAVQDLAEEFEFRFSPGALELIEQARQERDSALVVKPAEPKTTPKPVKTEGGIDESLRDDD